jgi:iron transport multicopper oxidase
MAWAFIQNVALPAFALSHLASAATIQYDFDIGWVRANPDGEFERPVIGINGQWPIPTIFGSVGDQIIVNAHNSLGNQTTSLHFHGLYMNGTTHMDGPGGVTQCDIPPGSSMTYNFTVCGQRSARFQLGRMLILVYSFPNQEHIGTILIRTLNIR